MATTKPYTLPQGLTGLLDPSSAEVAYIQGLSRAGVPAGLLQMGLNDTQGSREQWLERLFAESGALNDRTQRLNEQLMLEDRYKTNLGAAVDMGKAENPSAPNVGRIPLLGLQDDMNRLFGTERTQRVMEDADSDFSDARVRRDKNDRSRRFEQTGAGIHQMRQGGYSALWDDAPADVLVGSPMMKVDPLSIERQKIEEAGKTARETLPKVTTVGDPSGNVTQIQSVGPDAGTSMRGIEQYRQRTGEHVPAPTTESQAPGNNVPKPTSQRVPDANERASTMADIVNGRIADPAVYNGVRTTKTIASEMEIMDTGKYPFLKGAKPAENQRNWSITPRGFVRDYTYNDGRRVRMLIEPLPGGGARVQPQIIVGR